jgi:perosamine synthetase
MPADDGPRRGPPIPLVAPFLGGNEREYVMSCIDTSWVSSAGPFVSRFEQALAERVGASHGVATASGTAALHVALLLAGVEPGDEVLVSTLSFIAPANAIRYCGAEPLFIDADPAYWQMDVDLVRTFLDDGCELRSGQPYDRLTGQRVRALLPVHILGHPVDMEPLVDLARRYDVAVVEDASEALGATYKGRPAGNLGDLGCFSFNGNKIATSGGGGAIITDHADWAERAAYLTTQAKDDPLEYVHQEIGFNYRLTNLQAALGFAQLEQLDSFVAAKRRIARGYDEAFQDVPGITCMPRAPWAESSCWLYTILVGETVSRAGSRDVMSHLETVGIQTRPLWQPLHLSPAHSGARVLGGGVAERLNRQALSLPCSVGLSTDDQRRVIEEVLKVLR